MVVFTCNHCGDTLQKPTVAKHYQFRCRKMVFVTCMDCLKDFREDEYVAHTKCITEAERYGGKDYVPRGVNKGERKQQEWICVVNNLLHGMVDLSNAEKNFLNTLSKFENIPRKKTKFLNFVKNAIGNRVNMTVIESVWDKMEMTHKQHQETTVQSLEADNHKINKTDLNVSSINNDYQKNIVDNQNNENICKEYNFALYQNGDNKTCETNGTDEKQTVKKKKSIKRKLPESVEIEEEQPALKTKKGSVLLETYTCDNKESNVAFDWKSAILDIVQKKGKISLKKLEKKIVSLYLLNSTKNIKHEKAVAKFQKKLRKISEIFVSENIVKLVQ